jgi:hypothetical protein
VDKVVLGRVFSEYFGFFCHSSFHQILHQHNHPEQATIGQSVTAVPSGPSWTPSFLHLTRAVTGYAYTETETKRREQWTDS